MSKRLVTRHLKNAKEIRKYGICPPPLLREFGDRKTIHKIRKRFKQKRTAEDKKLISVYTG